MTFAYTSVSQLLTVGFKYPTSQLQVLSGWIRFVYIEAPQERNSICNKAYQQLHKKLSTSSKRSGNTPLDHNMRPFKPTINFFDSFLSIYFGWFYQCKNKLFFKLKNRKMIFDDLNESVGIKHFSLFTFTDNNQIITDLKKILSSTKKI